MRALVAGLIVAGFALVLLAMPVRREVAGWSMAPGLRPGEVVASGWFPAFDRLRPPVRHERWIVVAPDGTEAIKRVAAGPGERVRIVEGDLEIDGRIEPPPPWCLVERATVVETVVETAGKPVEHDGDDRPGFPDGSRLLWNADASSVLDDASFAPQERRLLLPVRDIGVCVLVRVRPEAAQADGNRLVIGIDGRAAAWRPSASARFAVLVGRVDRHFVGAAWPASQGKSRVRPDGWRLPQQAPGEWSLATPWAEPISGRVTVSVEGPAITVEVIRLWRDVLYRPAADGRTAWDVGGSEVLLLGDFPSGSVDSRQFGPLPIRALVARIP
jgi:type IV secretory pathway protease TraF